MCLQVRRRQALERLDSGVIELGLFPEPVNQRPTWILLPRFHHLDGRGPRNGIRQNRENDHEQIAAQLVHVHPLRRL